MTTTAAAQLWCSQYQISLFFFCTFMPPKWFMRKFFPILEQCHLSCIEAKYLEKNFYCIYYLKIEAEICLIKYCAMRCVFYYIYYIVLWLFLLLIFFDISFSSSVQCYVKLFFQINSFGFMQALDIQFQHYYFCWQYTYIICKVYGLC